MNEEKFLLREEKKIIDGFISRFQDLIGDRTETFEVKGTETDEDFFTAKVIGNKSVVVYVPINKTKLVWDYILTNYEGSLTRKLMDDGITKFWVNQHYDYKTRKFSFRKK